MYKQEQYKRYNISRIIGLIVFFTMPLSANATMYKCTDVSGNVSFSDTPCPTEKQEILKKRSHSTPSDTKTTETMPEVNNDIFPQLEPIRPLAGGKKVTSSSPLGKAYMKFINALKRCDLDTMMKIVSNKMAKAMSSATGNECKDGCKLLRMLMPQDLKHATEVIDGNNGKIQWLTVKSTTDASGTRTMKSEQTEEFIKEDGVWKYGE